MKKKGFFNFDEIHIRIILLDVLRNIWLAVLVALSVCIFTYAYKNYVYEPSYTSEATFVVSPRSNASYVSFYASLNTASEMAEVFQEVFSSEVLKRMIREDIQDPSAVFSIATSVAEGTNILRVSATAKTPWQAQRVMQALLQNYGEVSGYLFGGVVLDVLRSPKVPTIPSNPFNMRKNLVVFMAISLLSVLCIIVVLSVFRPTLKTVAAAKRSLGESPLGVLSKEKYNRYLFKKNEKKPPLITDPGISFQYTESVLQVAHKIQHKMKKKGQKSILVTSVAENEGKSTFSVNLALTLAKYGNKVALVDTDLRRPALFKILERPSNDDFTTCLKNGSSFFYDKANRIYVFAPGRPCSSPGKVLHSTELSNLVEKLKLEMDFVILDSAPYTAAADTGMLLYHADCCLMVVRQDWASRKICVDVADDLDDGKAEYIGYIMNGYISSKGIHSYNSYYGKYGYYGKKQSEEQ